MDEIAEEAKVSRATAYRYFPSLPALLCEAPLDDAVPGPDDVFADETSQDPETRVDKAEAALHAMVYRNETQLRLMLAETLKARSDDKGKRAIPVRQSRRIGLIQAALSPTRDKLDDASYNRLCAALALFFGPESMIVFRDVLPLSERQAREVKSWAVRSLVRSALDASRTVGSAHATGDG